jgi:hypothetical protein
MNNIARLLAKAFKGFGFTLLVFDFNALNGGRMNYISNAQRPDMIAAMKEFIAADEARAHAAPGTKQ